MRYALLLVLALASCHGDGTPSSSGAGASCDDAAENLIRVCDAYTGEDFRALCEADSELLSTFQNRQCVAEVTACDEASLEKCNARHVHIACDENADCPHPLQCNTAIGECARCLSDADCSAGRGCLMELCFDKDSEFYKRISVLTKKSP